MRAVMPSPVWCSARWWYVATASASTRSRRKAKAGVPTGAAIAPDAPLCLPGAGRIVLGSGRGGGVRPGHAYRIGFGAPGWHCRPAGRPRKTLAQLAQEHGLPPWLRSRLPLLYVDGELAAVADLCVCEGFVAPPGAASLRLDWRPG